jgi:hypothetical protein
VKSPKVKIIQVELREFDEEGNWTGKLRIVDVEVPDDGFRYIVTNQLPDPEKWPV